MSQAYQNLFQPIGFGHKLTVPGRLWVAPFERNLAQRNGGVSEEVIGYYTELAQGGAPFITVEASTVDFRGRARPRQIGIFEDRHIEGLAKLVESIHRAGSSVSIQLQHAGRQTTSDLIGGLKPVAPSAIPCKVHQEEPEELVPDQIEEVVIRFGEAATRALQAGFDGVTIHGAHGYLLHQFVSPYSNKRTDGWGEIEENRMRFPLAVAQGIINRVGDRIPVFYRMTADEFVAGGFGVEEAKRLARRLEEVGVDGLSVSAGIDETGRRIAPPADQTADYLHELARQIKGVVDIPVFSVGKMGLYLEIADEGIGQGEWDVVEIGRAAVADPQFFRKVREGKMEEINECTYCNDCARLLRNREGVYCTQYSARP